MKRIWLLGLLLLAPAVDARPVEARERPNVLLLSVDTLRPDALHSYGHPLEITPAIDGLGGQGVLFEDAVTTIGKTGPAFSSLFTSLSPPTHGARRNGIPMRPDVPTLAEILRDAGWSTAAFISNWTLRSRLAKVHRGFEIYDEEFDAKRNIFGARERTADAVIDATIRYLDQSGTEKPHFLWVHFSEPHTPYDTHDGVTVPEPPEEERGDGWQKRWRYANEVAFTDTRIAHLLSELGERIDLDDTIVVFVGDHGESLGEHSYWGHGKNTHWPNLSIPLILTGPGIPAGRRIEEPVMITDILPTLLDLLGLEGSLEEEARARLEGVSLAASWNGDGLDPERLRFTVGDRHTAFGSHTRKNYEDPKEISLQSPRVKVVFDFSTKDIVYYDLLADPEELLTLSEPPTDVKPPWRRRLANWYRELPKYEGSTGVISEEDRKQLESLGYVGAP